MSARPTPWTWLMATVLVVLLLSCEPPTAIRYVTIDNPRRFDPEADHGWDWRTLYEQAENCIGVGGDYDRLRFYWADRIQLDGEDRAGTWRPPHAIYLVGPGTYDRLVRHEMLHDLLRPGDHDDPHFKRCARNP